MEQLLLRVQEGWGGGFYWRLRMQVNVKVKKGRGNFDLEQLLLRVEEGWGGGFYWRLRVQLRLLQLE